MEKRDLRIVFMGTPEFAVGTLSRLVEGGYNVVAVVTQPDKAVGRHHETLQPSQVKTYAVEHNIPVLQPEKMKDEVFLEALRAYNADLQVVVAFRMLPEVVWAMPRYGTFNVHAALLPKYRGAAPINWAVINGETETGVTTFFLDHDIDTGRVILQEKMPIGENDNVETVYNGLMNLGADAALRTIDLMLKGDGQVDSIPQESILQYSGDLPLAPKIFKDTCRIDWNRSVSDVHNFVRGLSPYPGAWTVLRLADGKETELKVFSTLKTDRPSECEPGSFVLEGNNVFVNTSDNLLQILELQLSGKRRMSARDFLNGSRQMLTNAI